MYPKIEIHNLLNKMELWNIKQSKLNEVPFEKSISKIEQINNFLSLYILSNSKVSVIYKKNLIK